jgi:hypothetical protein
MWIGKNHLGRNVAAAVLSAAVLAVLFGCGLFDDSETFPRAILGHWETDAPGYEQCYMDITETTISFHTIEGTTDVNFIQKIERTEKDGDTVYDIHYENRDGDEFLLSVTLSGANQKGTLQFYNQKYLTWNKVDWTKF